MAIDRGPARWQNQFHWLIIVLFSTVILVSYCYHPDPNPTITLCAFKTATGLPCPGCGLTRAFCAMAKGQPLLAAHFNLLGPPLFLLMLLVWLSALLSAFKICGPFNWLLDRLTQPRLLKWSMLFLGVYWAGRIIFLLVTVGSAETIGRGAIIQLLH